MPRRATTPSHTGASLSIWVRKLSTGITSGSVSMLANWALTSGEDITAAISVLMRSTMGAGSFDGPNSPPMVLSVRPG